MKNMFSIGFMDRGYMHLTETMAPGLEYTPGVFRKQDWHNYHPESRWCFVMNHKRNAFSMEKIKKNTMAELYSVNLDEPTVMYKVPVSIYSTLSNMFGFDYWYNYDYIRIDDSIFYILSDFTGIHVYDTCLRIVFDLPVTHSMSRFGDVYGFHFDNVSRQLISWMVIDEEDHKRMLRKARGIREPIRRKNSDSDSEDDQRFSRPKFNYDNVSLVPETERTYHNIFVPVHG